jgi:hypothetical protein
MAAFPNTLPAPLVAGYSVSPQQQVRRTEMETGAARVRVQSRAYRDMVSLTWKFTYAEFETFRAWFTDMAGAAFGSAWFTIALPTGVGAVAPSVMTVVMARFSSSTPPWSATPSYGGKVYTVNTTLELRANV